MVRFPVEVPPGQDREIFREIRGSVCVAKGNLGLTVTQSDSYRGCRMGFLEPRVCE